MRNIKNILLFTIILSSVNVFIGITKFEYKDLFSQLYANESDYLSNYIVLSNYKTNTSIQIKKGMPVKINKKMGVYTFVSYDIKNNDINLISKKDVPLSLNLENINYISVQIESLTKDNVWGGIGGGLAGAMIGGYPSALAGWVVGMTLDMDNGSSPFPMLACMGITAAGTALSAQVGYNLGNNAGNPYVHIPLNGKESWLISIK